MQIPTQRMRGTKTPASHTGPDQYPTWWGAQVTENEKRVRAERRQSTHMGASPRGDLQRLHAPSIFVEEPLDKAGCINLLSRFAGLEHLLLDPPDVIRTALTRVASPVIILPGVTQSLEVQLTGFSAIGVGLCCQQQKRSLSFQNCRA
jgi:hypothetical protein